MLPTTFNYNVWPSVIIADKVSRMTITAAERAYMIPDGEVFTLKIVSVNTDENYYEPSEYKTLEVSAEGGALSFDFEFVGEGEHLIQLISEDRVIDSFVVYSLYEDLYERIPLKGDLHSHSCRSDGSRDAASQAGHYREQGYDFVALTDHNRFYPGGEIDEVYAGVDTGLIRVPGEEVHSPGSVVHIVAVGGKYSVVERYVHDRESYDAEIEDYLKRVPENIPEKFKDRYAKAMWATDAIHKAGGIAIFPHPFWRPGSKSYNLKSDHASILLSSGMFDAYELVGAMTQADINLSLALWNEACINGVNIPVVGSSDAHGLERASTFPTNRTICFAKEKSSDAIIAAVKEGMCVAAESSGSDYTVQHRCYGSFRLVSYAQFLFKYYFPNTQRLAAGAGVAMRAYAMEEIDSSVINGLTAMVDDYTARFFGRKPARLPSAAMLDFEDKWRKVQLAGPKTRGSAVDGMPAKSLI